ncbi:biotin/lipoate A/B protein ligase family protein, partial [Ferrimicrobium sp.]|uniref:lipoate--protein ligase family protein n=2 Tax=Ferrimicrobium sp. TaxID=2926050 RepID=UPI00260167DE
FVTRLLTMASSTPIRVIRAFAVSPLHSQAIYHAIAEAFTDDTPDTICLVQPSDPYISIGYHQDAQNELDLGRVADLGLGVIRRQVGGGAVYLDANQVFVQWIFSPNSLPHSIEARYQLFIGPIVETYRELGIPAEMRPINDIQVSGRKIGGCGAARIGRAEVLVSSFMFDIDLNTMASVLRVDTEKMRDKLYHNLQEYITCITSELALSPEPERVLEIYLTKMSDLLERPITPVASLTADEKTQLISTEHTMAQESWTNGGGGRRVAGLTIKTGTVMHHAVYKAAGGLIRWVLFLDGRRILDASLEGDFTVYPLDAPLKLATAIVGDQLDLLIGDRWNHLYREIVEDAPGVSSEDLMQPLLRIAADVM